MAPHFRPSTQTRRGARGGYVEHDDFEGLPVRQWREEWVSVAHPPPTEANQKDDIWAVELPYGMPRDSSQLPQHTQDLLRAARSGRLYKPIMPTDEDDIDVEMVSEKPERKEEDLGSKSFLVRTWKQIPRSSEGPTVSHLAKRRKGTVTLSSNLPVGVASGSSVTKATVRRIDAAGNPYTQEITLHEGQSVDGEIISTTVVAAPVANTTGEGSPATTPARRRPPPPKRKPKGPGRGRKKKMLLPLPSQPQPSGSGLATFAPNPKAPGVDGLEQQAVADEPRNQDTEMGEGDDDDEGDDDGDDGDDGDEGDYGDFSTDFGTPNEKEMSVNQDIKHSPSVDPPVVSASAQPGAMNTSTGDEAATPARQSSPLSLGVHTLETPWHLRSPRFEGSPLKNVVLPSPTDPSPNMSPPVKTGPSSSFLLNARSSLFRSTTAAYSSTADGEMTSMRQTQTVIKTEPSTQGGAGQALSWPEVMVEEVVETTSVPLNDTDSGTTKQEAVDVTDAPAEGKQSASKVASPVVEEPETSSAPATGEEAPA